MRTKIIVTIILAVILVPLSAICAPIIKNNHLLNHFSHQLYDLPLPPQTTLVSKTKAVGNLSPTGNHLDFAAAMEVKSSLTEEQLSAYYNGSTLKTVDKLCFLKPDPDGISIHDSVDIEVIPKNQVNEVYGTWRTYVEVNEPDPNIAEDLFIIQITDIHYAPGHDMRAH